MRLDFIPERLRASIRRRLRQQALPALIIAALLAVAIGTAISMMGSSSASQVILANDPSSAPTPFATESVGTLYVHVTGAVNEPGLVTVSVGARLVDVIAAAGGFASDADQSGVNLARAVKDGEQIVVPVVGAVTTGDPAGSASAAGASGGLINLNSADAAALETLPRVGPAMAARIIAWREAHGGFTSVDDLRQVTGIGEKTFAEIAPLVTV